MQGERVSLGYENSSMWIGSQNGYKILVFEGDLDYFNAPKVDLDPFCTEDLIIDFQQVTYVDCAWVWKLVACYKKMTENGCRLIIVKSAQGRSLVEHILTVVKFNHLFVFRTSIDSAHTSLA